MVEGIRAGTIVDGRYTLEKLLGEGTFGDVWRARDQRLAGRAVAIKFLKPEHMEQPELVARFEGEADALALLRHPNVVAVTDRGRWQGLHYVVTEFVEGVPLKDWLAHHRREGRMTDLATVRALFDQICAGVEAAHATRTPGAIVHRDIKPDNVIVQELSPGEFAAKVLDFGVAQLGGRKGTRTGVSIGTPRYMAPEQAMGEAGKVGPWTDVFALGVVLIEMLTLRAQFAENESWWATVIQSGPALRDMLAGMRADVPPALWDTIARALRLRGSERYPDAGALRRALREAWSSSGPQAAVRQSSLSVDVAAPTVHQHIGASAATPSPWLRTPTVPNAPAAPSQATGQLPTLPEVPSAISPPSEPSRTRARDRIGGMHTSEASAFAMPQGSVRSHKRILYVIAAVFAALVMVGVGIILQSLFLATPVVNPRVDAASATQGASQDAAEPMRRSPQDIALGTAARLLDAATVLVPLAPASGPAAAAAASASAPPPLASEPFVEEFLRGLYRDAIETGGELPIDEYYAPRARFRTSEYVPGEPQRFWRGFLSRGGTFTIDWSRSTVERESPLAGSDAERYCLHAPGGEGPVYKVRAWATEYTPRRSPEVGCPQIEGVYLFRVRQIFGQMRVCYESWSLREGVCASCPSAPACQGLPPESGAPP